VKKGAFIIVTVAAVAGIAVGIALAAGAVGDEGSGGDASAKEPSARLGRPVLYPLGQNPLRVKGTGFKHGERVRVTASGASRRVQANDRGSFVATLKNLRACDAGTVLAKGDRGSRASFNVASVVCEVAQ
jgi:hypothetical protein